MNSPILRSCNLSPPKGSLFLSSNFTLSRPNNPNSKLFHKSPAVLPQFSFKTQFVNRRNLSTICSLNSSVEAKDAKSIAETSPVLQSGSANRWKLVEVCNPNVPPFISSWVPKFSWTDQAFFLLTFIACTTSVALVSFVAAAVPSLHAMGRAANSLTKLADAAREELPSTMAAIRLSGMEISDLTLELSDLSQEISEGVNKSAQAVQAAENGIRQIGALACKQTASLIQERASLPVINLQPVVSGAAEKTSRAVGYATKTFMNLISGLEFVSENKEDSVDSWDI